jgi:hypothetical protein
MFRSYVFIVSVLLISCSSTLAGTSQKWPQIKKVSWSGEIDLLGSPTVIEIPTQDPQVTYRLFCSSRLAESEPDWLLRGEMYGADFACLLTDTPVGKEADRATLLNPDPKYHRPYGATNRGNFTWDELLGDCWNDPEWGSDRKLFLRNMLLRIHVIGAVVELYNDPDAKKSYPIIRRVTVRIDAEECEDANTELVRPSKTKQPIKCMQ